MAEIDSLKKQAFSNSMYRFAWSLINRVGALIFTIYLARVLLPKAFGTYTLVLSIALILYGFTDLGVNTALSRFVAVEIGKGNKNRAAAYARYLLKIKMFLVIGAAGLLFLLSYPLAYFIYNKPELFLPLIFASVYIFVFSLEGFIDTFFYILKEVKYLSIKEFFTQALRILLVIIIFSVSVKTFYVAGAYLAQIITIILIIILLLYWLKKIAPMILIKTKEKIDKSYVKRFLTFLTIGSISTIFFVNIDTLMLGWFIPDNSFVGFYRAAFSIVISAGGLLFLNFVFVPIFAQIKDEKFGGVFNRVMKYSFLLTIPAAFGLVAIRKYAIRLLYGYDYLPAALPLTILAFLVIEISSGGLIYSALSARGRIERSTKMLLISTILNIVLNIALISYFVRYSYIMAVLGAGIATLTSRAIYFVSLIFLINKELGVSLRKINIIKPLIASVVMFGVLYGIDTIIKDMTIITGGLQIIAGIAVYFVVLLIIKGISMSDIIFLQSTIKRKNK